MFDELTIKLLFKNGDDPIIFYLNERVLDDYTVFELYFDGKKIKRGVENGKDYFTSVFINQEDDFDVVAYFNTNNIHLKFLRFMSKLRVDNNLSPIKIIKSSDITFRFSSSELTINAFMNRELMTEEDIMADVKAKVCKELKCDDPAALIINLENLTIAIRVPNYYKIIYPDKKFKRIILYIDHSRENILKELVKVEPRIQIVRIIKKGDNRFHVHVIQKISQTDALEKMSDYILLDNTSPPITPSDGKGVKKSKRFKKSKGIKKSKKR